MKLLDIRPRASAHISRVTLLAGTILLAGFCIAASAFSLSVAQTSREENKPSGALTDKEKPMLALKVVRIINTAEAWYHKEYGKYAPWEEVFNSPVLSKIKETPYFARQMEEIKLTAGPEVVPGFELRILLSPDASRYNLSLEEEKKGDVKGCQVYFYSDERGLIQEGTNIGCQVQLTMAPVSVAPAVVVTAKGTPSAPMESPSSSPKRVRVGGPVEQAMQLQAPKPQYPENARAKGIQGVVMLEAVISKEGIPLSQKVLGSPDPELSSAAMEAVRQWRYRPTLLNGEPIEVVTTIAVRFQLER